MGDGGSVPSGRRRDPPLLRPSQGGGGGTPPPLGRCAQIRAPLGLATAPSSPPDLLSTKNHIQRSIRRGGESLA